MLVDEVSMLDLPLAAALMSAISPRSFFQLVLVGEHLPSADLQPLVAVGPVVRAFEMPYKDARARQLSCIV